MLKAKGCLGYEPPGKGSSFSILATLHLAVRGSKMCPLNVQQHLMFY